MYCLLTFQVTAWGFDYVVAKQALELLQPLTLLTSRAVSSPVPLLRVMKSSPQQ